MSASIVDPAIEEMEAIWADLTPAKRVKLQRVAMLTVAVQGDEVTMRALLLLETADEALALLEAPTRQH